jgi:hypothetical protein
MTTKSPRVLHSRRFRRRQSSIIAGGLAVGPPVIGAPALGVANAFQVFINALRREAPSGPWPLAGIMDDGFAVERTFDATDIEQAASWLELLDAIGFEIVVPVKAWLKHHTTEQYMRTHGGGPIKIMAVAKPGWLQ